MPDLEQLVRAAAAGPTRGVDPDALWRRARRQVWTTRLAITFILAGVVGSVALTLTGNRVVVIDVVGEQRATDGPSPREPLEPFRLAALQTVRVTTIDDLQFQGTTLARQDELDRLWEQLGAEGRAPSLPDGMGAVLVPYTTTGCFEPSDIVGLHNTDMDVTVYLSERAESVRTCGGAQRVMFTVLVPEPVRTGRTVQVIVGLPEASDVVPVPLPLVDEAALRRQALSWIDAIVDGRPDDAIEAMGGSDFAERMVDGVAKSLDQRREVHGDVGTPRAGVMLPGEARVAICLEVPTGDDALRGGLAFRPAPPPRGWVPQEFIGYVGCQGPEAAYGSYPRETGVGARGWAAVLATVVGLVILVGDRQARRWAAAHPGPRKTRQDPGRDYPYTQTWRY